VDNTQPGRRDILVHVDDGELVAMLNCMGLVIEKLDESDFHPLIEADRDEVETLFERLRALRPRPGTR